MKMVSLISSLLLISCYLILTSPLSLAQEEEEGANNEATEEGGIDVSEKEGYIIIKIPEEMKKAPAYRLSVTPPKNDEEKPVSAATDINLLIFQANLLFNEKQYDEALSLLGEANRIDSKNKLIKNMIGSTFYRLKDFDQARDFWNQSIKIDPNQPDVVDFLKKVERKRTKKKHQQESVTGEELRE